MSLYTEAEAHEKCKWGWANERARRREWGVKNSTLKRRDMYGILRKRIVEPSWIHVILSYLNENLNHLERGFLDEMKRTSECTSCILLKCIKATRDDLTSSLLLPSSWVGDCRLSSIRFLPCWTIFQLFFCGDSSIYDQPWGSRDSPHRQTSWIFVGFKSFSFHNSFVDHISGKSETQISCSTLSLKLRRKFIRQSF